LDKYKEQIDKWDDIRSAISSYLLAMLAPTGTCLHSFKREEESNEFVGHVGLTGIRKDSAKILGTATM